VIRDELDVLLEKVDDEALRAELRSRIDRLRQRRSYGLVFERHIPERVRLPQHRISVGSRVVDRGGEDNPTWEVLAIASDVATLRRVRNAEGEYLERNELPGDNAYGESAESLDRYFLPLAVAARLELERQSDPPNLR
jgi:hypothetical protein